MAGATLDDRFGSYRQILWVAAPLILSQTSVMVMQIVDGLFLAHYSPQAIAAVGPAAMAFWSVAGLFIGLTGYTGTFVAQYVGAGRPDRVGAAVWQGVYASLAAAVLVALASLLARPLFDLVGHAPTVRELEVTYYRIYCWGGVTVLLGSALSGFYAGRNDNAVLLVMHLLGVAVNAFLDWVLIFGALGFPEWGMAGAAWATVAGHGASALLLGVFFFARKHRQRYGTWIDRPFDLALAARLCAYGFPSGVRMVIEILAWTLFVMFLGRVGKLELAASNIVWRINGVAFFPVIGLAIAVSMLVGQAQGAGRPDLAERVTRRGLALAEAWMLAAGLIFVLIPAGLMGLFLGGAAGPDDRAVAAMGVVLLRFVAVYCLLDGFNIVLMSALQGAGDTRWTLLVSAGLHLGFLALLIAMDRARAGLYVLWAVATVFVLANAAVWFGRFRSGKWKPMRVIEHAPPDLASAGGPAGAD